MPRAVPKVVIVGAGFGGLSAASRLVGRAVDVTIVDRRNHHVFQPLLYQVATAGLSPADIAAPIRSIFADAPNVRVILDEVTGVAKDDRRVHLARGAPLDYDWLILATGARHSYFGREDWAQHAPGLKSIDDAIAIRRRILLALEQAETETDPRRRAALLTFVVVGGGPTGVEMAGAIAELARRTVSREFRSITPQCSRVILAEAGPRILSTFPPELSAKAQQSLQELGVEVHTDASVSEIAGGSVVIGGERISAGAIVWGAGVQASPAAQWLRAEHDRHGRVYVDVDLRVPGCDRIFAIGDTARLSSLDGRPVPAVAPAAKQQGRFVADWILGRHCGAFRYRSVGNMATIGRSRAVIDWGRHQQSGFGAWLVWSCAHIWFLIDFRSRLAVGLNWLWNYLTYRRSARLITGDAADLLPQTMSREAA